MEATFDVCKVESPLEKNAVRNAGKHTETKVFGLQTSTMADTKFGDPKTEESLQSVKEAVPQGMNSWFIKFVQETCSLGQFVQQTADKDGAVSSENPVPLMCRIKRVTWKKAAARGSNSIKGITRK